MVEQWSLRRENRRFKKQSVFEKPGRAIVQNGWILKRGGSVNWESRVPTRRGRYYVKWKETGQELIARLDEHGWSVEFFDTDDGWPEAELLKMFLFGREIPSNDECVAAITKASAMDRMLAAAGVTWGEFCKWMMADEIRGNR